MELQWIWSPSGPFLACDERTDPNGFKSGKRGILTFWVQKSHKVEKWAHFPVWDPKIGKMGPFSHFGPQSAKKGARNPLFNKPFGPGRKMSAEMRFWAQKCDFGGHNWIWSPKWPKSAFWESKITFWGPFRSLAQKAYETKGFVAPFSHFWNPNPKMSSFSTFGQQNAKKGSFCTFWAKSAKMSSFSVFGSQSEKKGSWNLLFNKPFDPGRKMTPKVHFWAQKCVW